MWKMMTEAPFLVCMWQISCEKCDGASGTGDRSEIDGAGGDVGLPFAGPRTGPKTQPGFGRYSRGALRRIH